MGNTVQDRARRRRQRGMTIVELLIALTVLAIGMAGSAVLIATAITSNNRGKVDAGATLLAQMVLDHYASVPASSTVNIPLSDCSGAASTNLSTTGVTAAAGSGATVAADGTISYAQNFADIPAGYRMTYTSCGAGGRQVAYEVRVNVRTIATNAAGTLSFSKLVTVSTRPAAAQALSGPRFFAPPVTLRTIVGT